MTSPITRICNPEIIIVCSTEVLFADIHTCKHCCKCEFLKLKRQREESSSPLQVADKSPQSKRSSVQSAIMGVEELKATIAEQIKNTHVLAYCKTTCPFCSKIKSLFKAHCVDCTFIELDLLDNTDEWMEALGQMTGQRTVPNVFINGKHIGGCDTTISLHSRGELAKILVKGQQERDVPDPSKTYDYDVIVIGGGSGGLACAKELGTLGASVACVDFVKPTPVGTSWGLGGTCVNVGCIPKKLMHQASLLGESLDDARLYGWEFSEEKKHNWTTMVTNIQDHIGSLNWGYRVALRDKNVKYINSLATFTDPHTIKHVNKRGKEATITAARFVISVGGRPKYPAIPGAREYGITSDDIFSLMSPPGKTLVIGASYVALECAGFLAGLGIDVTVMVRSILLRGFDQQMADLGGDWMADHNVKFIRKCVPQKIELIEEGPPRKLKVTYENTETKEIATDEFNTIMFGIGRDADTNSLGLEAAGVKTTSAGKIPTVYEQTNVPHIYAIGDVVEQTHELTPLAIQAGKLLAGRLFGQKTLFTDYVNIPTTIFMPLEFGTIGLSEERATEIYGTENIEVYHTYFTPLEFTVAKKGDNKCYAKLICNKTDEERVIGFHVLGPNAGEITQGYGVAIRLGAKKIDFDATIGIHPTNSEQFTNMYITKASGVNVATQGC